MLLNKKGNNVAIPSYFHTMRRQAQEFFLAPLREINEPRSHKGATGFSVEARAKLK